MKGIRVPVPGTGKSSCQEPVPASHAVLKEPLRQGTGSALDDGGSARNVDDDRPGTGTGTGYLRYIIPGRPVTWARTNIVRGRPVTDAAQRRAKTAHALMASATLRGKPWPQDGTFAIGVVGYWPDGRLGDLDRLVSLPMDALQGVLWKTDRQVRRLLDCLMLIDRDNPRTEVTVRRLEG